MAAALIDVEAVEQRVLGIGAGLDLFGQLQHLGILELVGGEPAGIGGGIQQVAGDDKGHAELGLHQGGEAVLGAVHPVLRGRIDHDLLDILRLDAVLLGHQIHQLHRGLHPHVGGPVLDEDLHHHELVHVTVQPGAVHRGGQLLAVAVGDVEAALHVGDAVFGAQGRLDAALGDVAPLIVIGVGHGGLLHVGGHLGEVAGQAVGLVNLGGIQAQQLGGGGGGSPDVPVGDGPPLAVVKLGAGLHGHGHPHADLKAGDEGGQVLLAGGVPGLGHGHADGHGAGGGVAGPGAVLPVQDVGDGAVDKDGVGGGQLLAGGPHGGGAAGAVVQLPADFHAVLRQLVVLGGQGDAQGM